ncbi:hypothetical protein, partial [Desulfobulbus sp.]|uniref:hypothetical protein n=1 Tax=Desulfobulbus sp. TaxID=895 RepID=UPI0027B9A757
RRQGEKRFSHFERLYAFDTSSLLLTPAYLIFRLLPLYDKTACFTVAIEMESQARSNKPAGNALWAFSLPAGGIALPWQDL